MKVKIASIKKNRYEDGPGIRTTIFFQGCNVKCRGCHNERIQDIRYGKEYEERWIHIHDKEYTGVSYNCIGIELREKLNQLKENLEEMEKIVKEKNNMIWQIKFIKSQIVSKKLDKSYYFVIFKDYIKIITCVFP